MKIRGLDGREYHWRLTGHIVRGDDDRPRSKYHLAARELLHHLYPADRILEELFLPGLPVTEFADFYLPLRQLMVEVQGEQHYKFIHYFHHDRLGYLSALRRDIDKQRWCAINGIGLVALPFYEDQNEWARRILDPYAKDRGPAV